MRDNLARHRDHGLRDSRRLEGLKQQAAQRLKPASGGVTQDHLNADATVGDLNLCVFDRATQWHACHWIV